MSGVRDSISYQHGQLVRKRYYTERDQTLRENQELQKADGVRAVDGFRPFARFPEHELKRLAEKGRADKDAPSWLSDLDCPDPQIQDRAKRRLMNSSLGNPYRVGSTSRKVFHFRNNPLAR